jgi:hypothetical protein
LEQHFLVNPDRIEQILSHAAPTSGDHFIELGAGEGTIARHLPPIARLTLVERDSALAADLAARFPDSEVRAIDAIPTLADLSGDVLLVSLPHTLVGSVLDLIRPGNFRCALVAIREGQDLTAWQDRLAFTSVVSLSGRDFRPTQPFASEVVEVRDLASF